MSPVRVSGLSGRRLAAALGIFVLLAQSPLLWLEHGLHFALVADGQTVSWPPPAAAMCSRLGRATGRPVYSVSPVRSGEIAQSGQDHPEEPARHRHSCPLCTGHATLRFVSPPVRLAGPLLVLVRLLTPESFSLSRAEPRGLRPAVRAPPALAS